MNSTLGGHKPGDGISDDVKLGIGGALAFIYLIYAACNDYASASSGSGAVKFFAEITLASLLLCWATARPKLQALYTFTGGLWRMLLTITAILCTIYVTFHVLGDAALLRIVQESNAVERFIEPVSGAIKIVAIIMLVALFFLALFRLRIEALVLGKAVLGNLGKTVHVVATACFILSCIALTAPSAGKAFGSDIVYQRAKDRADAKREQIESQYGAMADAQAHAFEQWFASILLQSAPPQARADLARYAEDRFRVAAHYYVVKEQNIDAISDYPLWSYLGATVRARILDEMPTRAAFWEAFKPKPPSDDDTQKYTKKILLEAFDELSSEWFGKFSASNDAAVRVVNSELGDARSALAEQVIDRAFAFFARGKHVDANFPPPLPKLGIKSQHVTHIVSALASIVHRDYGLGFTRADAQRIVELKAAQERIDESIREHSEPRDIHPI